MAQIDTLFRTNFFASRWRGPAPSHTLPGNQVETFGYDLAGNPILHTNMSGVVITNQFDVMNRLLNRSSIDGYQVAFTYTPTGQRWTMTDASGLTSYSYDSRDRLTNKWMSINGGPVWALNYGFDPNGNVTNLASTTIGGVCLAYRYDPLSRLTNVLANGLQAAGYGYDLNGNLTLMTYGTVVTNRYKYDPLNSLTSLICSNANGILASYGYQLGLTGNRTNLTEQVNNYSRTNAWIYDSLYRLTKETILTNGGNGNFAYSYDGVGNRTNRTVTGNNLWLTNQSFAFSTNDWLTIDHYDGEGNTTNSAGNSYYYDALDHLTNAVIGSSSITVVYDGDGNRISKTVGATTTYYLIDDRNPSGYAQVLEEWTATSGGASTLSRVYNYGLDLISQQSGGTTNYLLHDGHGSTRLLLTSSGTASESYVFDAYGTLDRRAWRHLRPPTFTQASSMTLTSGFIIIVPGITIQEPAGSGRWTSTRETTKTRSHSTNISMCGMIPSIILTRRDYTPSNLVISRMMPSNNLC